MTRTRRVAIARSAESQLCSMFVVDIAGYTDRDEEIQLYMRSALYDMLRVSFGASGIPWARCQKQDRGDGALIIIPSGIPAHSLVSPLLGQLGNRLRIHNRIVTAPARMQLRAAGHIGPVYRDNHGFAGDDLNLLCRMLDAQPLRRALAVSGSDLALIVSDHFYTTVIRRRPSLTDPAAFRPLRTVVKRTPVHAWIYAPTGTSITGAS
jgi:hypothetical protein